jgi:hypothetical protein
MAAALSPLSPEISTIVETCDWRWCQGNGPPPKRPLADYGFGQDLA